MRILKEVILVTGLFFIFLGINNLEKGYSAMLPLELQDLVSQADTIIIGKVKAKESKWEEGSTIVTYTTITVERYIKGESPQEITIKTYGGEVGDIGLLVSTEPIFKEGEKVLVFLRKDGEIFKVVSGLQGKYTITKQGILKENQKSLDLFIQEIKNLVSE